MALSYLMGALVSGWLRTIAEWQCDMEISWGFQLLGSPYPFMIKVNHEGNENNTQSYEK